MGDAENQKCENSDPRDSDDRDTGVWNSKRENPEVTNEQVNRKQRKCEPPDLRPELHAAEDRQQARENQSHNRKIDKLRQNQMGEWPGNAHSLVAKSRGQVNIARQQENGGKAPSLRDSFDHAVLPPARSNSAATSVLSSPGIRSKSRRTRPLPNSARSA